MAELNCISSIKALTKAYYRFESGALTTDSSGNGHTLTNVNGCTEQAGKFGGGAGLVRASNQVFTVAHHADFNIGTSPFTVGLWLKRSSVGAIYCGLIAKVDVDTTGFRFDISAGNTLDLTCFDPAGTDTVLTTETISDANLHFAVAVRDGSKLRIYIDGVQCYNTANDNARNIDNADVPFTIGAYRSNDLINHIFDGIIDDAFLINGLALTPTQILRLYSGGCDLSSGMIAFFMH